MPIIALLTRMRDKYSEKPHPLLAKAQPLRIGYLTGLAMQAHSDGQLAEEERQHFLEMAQIFGLNTSEADAILHRSQEPDEETVSLIRKCLIDSKHKYYFLLDLQIMAHQDGVLKAVESDVIMRFAELLDIAPGDRDFLISLANAVAEEDLTSKMAWQESFLGSNLASNTKPEDFVHYTET